ncbi:hypothetical protein ACIHCV_45700 [Streptomyces sp. NPDC051956]|uniref:hypothetical protein n=1 Tax=Streptomyces sp. NPDC051956 TaxID=3365677 RepID=UPI0037D97D35
MSMSDGTAAIVAAGIGAAVSIPGVIGAAVIAYRAGRRQVADQGVVDHRHWRRQIRFEAYEKFLAATDAGMQVLDDRVHGRAGNPAVLAALEQLLSAQARVRVAGPDAMWQQAQQAFHGVRLQLQGPRGLVPVPGQVWIGMVQSVTGPQDQFVVVAAKVLDDPDK